MFSKSNFNPFLSDFGLGETQITLYSRHAKQSYEKTQGRMQAKKLYHRQKLLLELLRIWGGSLPRTDFQKYLFLYTMEMEKEKKSYDFVPYDFGCFSFQSYMDLRRLVDFGLLESQDNSVNWKLKENRPDYKIDMSVTEALWELKKKHGKKQGKELISYVYRHYPYYAIKSKILDKVLSGEEKESLQKRQKLIFEGKGFFTIGYEGKSFDHYLSRLIRNGVRLLCDVRKNPISRKYGFSQSTLRSTLHKLGIFYIHMPELGIESSDRRGLATEQDYQHLFDMYEKRTLSQKENCLKELAQLVLEYERVAITCFEASHEMCHRGRVALRMRDYLADDCEPIHI